MPDLLADENAGGHLSAVLSVCRGPAWRDVWDALGVTVYDFAALGLPRGLRDDELWRFCQRRQILLFTMNRNKHGPASLSAVIAAEGTVNSLPVLTVADPARLLADRACTEEVAIALMSSLDECDRYRGTGRLWLP